MTAVIVATSTTAQTKILPRAGAKPLVHAGMTLGVVAMLCSRASARADLRHGRPARAARDRPRAWAASSPPAFGTATLGVRRTRPGVASAMVNTSQQVGGSVGTALLAPCSRAPPRTMPRATGHPGGRRRGRPWLHDGLLVGGKLCDLRSGSARRARRAPLRERPNRSRCTARIDGWPDVPSGGAASRNQPSNSMCRKEISPSAIRARPMV